MGQSTENRVAGSRCIALVGPYLSGKTSLLEAILFRTGAIPRQGKVTDGNTVGDSVPEARRHGMSVEINTATTEFLGDTYTFIDCPGSIEFAEERRSVLAACDAAIVVCEADDKKTAALQLVLKELETLGLPRLLFVNKIDKTETRIRDVLSFLQPASATPLVLRQIPIWENGIATGVVDLASERAYLYREHAEAEVIETPEAMQERQKEARFEMLEKLADYDDDMLETLLSDLEPPVDQVFGDLTRELSEGLITPVLLGSAENANGILRLMKTLRHDVPGIDQTVERLGFSAGDGATAQVLKTFYTAHGGKLSLVRLLSGEIADGATFFGANGQSARIAGLFRLMGAEPAKLSEARRGDVVALGRLEDIGTGETISTLKGETEQLDRQDRSAPVFGLAIAVKDRKDEVKLTSSIAKLSEEDPSVSLEHNQDTHELVLWGQGEMHLRVGLERLAGKFGVEATSKPRSIPYKESIRKSTSQRGRHKKQSGGHGQFGDVVVEISPQPRGTGFAFSDTISGGVVPKTYIPAVEAGIKEYLHKGPLGFPVIDIAVNLSDGSYHSVDSSEMAFKLAGRLAMAEGLPNCSPVLLEPIVHVQVHVPSEATSRINQIVSGHRGQILGFDARNGWQGWDTVEAHMPESEIGGLIIELRSATAGVGTFTFTHDHLSELSGRQAEEIISQRKAEEAA